MQLYWMVTADTRVSLGKDFDSNNHFLRLEDFHAVLYHQNLPQIQTRAHKHQDGKGIHGMVYRKITPTFLSTFKEAHRVQDSTHTPGGSVGLTIHLLGNSPDRDGEQQAVASKL